MTTKNTIQVTYEGPEEFGKRYRTGRSMRVWLNGEELEGVVDFKYEAGVNDFMNITLKLIVAEMEINRVDVEDA